MSCVSQIASHTRRVSTPFSRASKAVSCPNCPSTKSAAAPGRTPDRIHAPYTAKIHSASRGSPHPTVYMTDYDAYNQHAVPKTHTCSRTPPAQRTQSGRPHTHRCTTRPQEPRLEGSHCVIIPVLLGQLGGNSIGNMNALKNSHAVSDLTEHLVHRGLQSLANPRQKLG